MGSIQEAVGCSVALQRIFKKVFKTMTLEENDI